MSEYIFKKPFIYDNKWNVFEDAIYSNLELTDCNDSVTGTCNKTDNLEQCIGLCNEDCDFGYFIETPNKDNFCVPLKKKGDNVDYYHRLKNKSYYPVLDNMKTYSFARIESEFPSKIPNAVFYTDYFALKNVQTGLSVGISEDEKITEKIIYSKRDISVQMLPKQIMRSQVDQYIPVKNGDEVVFNIPDTSLILRKRHDNSVSWLFRASVAYVPHNIFKVNCNTKKIGEIINYGDTIYLTHEGDIVVYDSVTDNTSLQTITYENATKNKLNIFFNLVPKVQVYTCENNAENKCIPIHLKDTVSDGNRATYNGNQVYRQPNCWNMCNQPTKSNHKTIFIIIVLSLCLLLFFFYALR